jgi:catechol 2,3-dioxygenase-like lactoylglutathione lyase family enzyme
MVRGSPGCSSLTTLAPHIDQKLSERIRQNNDRDLLRKLTCATAGLRAVTAIGPGTALAAGEDRAVRTSPGPGHKRLIVRPWYTVPTMDWKIELVAIPVTDVDRAKAFYVDQVGFHADHDHQVNDALRFVQLTPPGSACSIVLGTGITQMLPGSQKGVQCVVADVEAARQQLIAHGVQASDVDVQPWGSFVAFSDPDGNTWTLQQLPPWS